MVCMLKVLLLVLKGLDICVCLRFGYEYVGRDECCVLCNFLC
jgi:hypothetical protein